MDLLAHNPSYKIAASFTQMYDSVVGIIAQDGQLLLIFSMYHGQGVPLLRLNSKPATAFQMENGSLH